MEKRKPIKTILRAVAVLLALVIAALVCFIIFAFVTELKVQDVETI